MTSYIKIGPSERHLGEATPPWIREKYMQEAGLHGSVCVIVRLQAPNFRMTLATPGCRLAGGGNGQKPREREQAILELWDRMNLNCSDFTHGNIVAFLNQLKRILQ